MLFMLFCLCISFQSTSTLGTVDSLKLSYYTGRWYQMYSNEVVIKSSQQHSMCTIVDYQLKSNKSLSVQSSFRKYSPNGKLIVANGDIIQPHFDAPGVMQLLLKTIPYPTPYLVIKLGPLHDNRYEYSIVTDNNNASLYVYARDIHKFRHYFQDDVIKFCRDAGFTNYYNQPIETPQPSACDYPDVAMVTTGYEVVCNESQEECEMQRLLKELNPD